ncbi:HlyD family efflux transporter periplasmic adaptor subunit [Rhodopirellula sp. P2]|uniref:HlyD family efflux transporter periplasmic adaptor subunit n=1 Tax=Rhodopirellula sp. P2 TaxID=2127060 RepID=UPI002367E161|nr:HlyD family efflux transporter periplasmic adaptor subunit [Rhodopirellula sp. P2]WDQ16717.1 HlyD family efflux transporter periplasmic adaptor subunit [Rhodopirellula sp. P2]
MTSTASSEPFVFAPSGSVSSDSSGRSASARGSTYAAPGVTSSHQLVDQARQEITQIVREVAAATHQPRKRADYLRFLADRVLRAMAGHGVVIWTRSSAGDPKETSYVAEHRLGRVTDLALVDEGEQVHQCLLAEVATEGAPVVVPPTPGADQIDVPANPLPYPAAIVPIRIDPSSALPEGLIEVFLDEGGTAASQRGSLRFLAQMSDLAGEFLRMLRLKTLSQLLDATDRVDVVVERLHRMTSTGMIQAAWVDAAAELLRLPRVALCRVDSSQPRIVAVSHVHRIDQHSGAAKAIRAATAIDLQPQHGIWFASCQAESNEGKPNEDDSSTAPFNHDQTPHAIESSQEPAWVVAAHPDSQWRIVGFTSDEAEHLSEDIYWGTLNRLLVGGASAWTAARRIESLPGGRWFSKLFVEPDAVSSVASAHASDTRSTSRRTRVVHSRIRKSATWMAATLTIAVLVCLPMPSLVPVTGVIRPVELDTYHAASDAVVETLHVDHGQRVQRGDLLATLTSTDLQEQETSLLGRQAVLLRQQEQVNQTLMSRPSDHSRPDSVHDGREVEEEIASVDRQLEIIRESKARLILRALRDGRVDAWRLQERLANRPLRRGDPVLNVIAEDTPWVVDARVPQTRLQTVDKAWQSEKLTAEVGTAWSSEMNLAATAQRFGPIVPDPTDGTPSVVMRLGLEESPTLGDQPLAEMPARVTLHCGRTPVGWFLVQDVVHWCQVQWGGYF